MHENNEKMKRLRQENKKLVQLVKDQERLFKRRLEEQRRENKALKAMLTQAWPYVKGQVGGEMGTLLQKERKRGDS